MISVIICTHNPREDYLRRALGGLMAQTLPKTQWELLVIDNASDKELHSLLDLSWHPGARVLREDCLGLTPARLRGIREASGDSLVFVDDDNVLAPNYLELSQRILDDHPFIGAMGGTSEGEFEVPVPEWATWALGGLGVRRVGVNNKPLWACSPIPGPYTPIGAGLVIRKAVADEYARQTAEHPESLQFDRKGSSLMSGGDIDMALCATNLQLAQGTFPELTLKHLISAKRLEFQHLKKLRYGLKYSGMLLKLRRGLTKAGRSKYPQWLSVWMRWHSHGRPLGKRGGLVRAGIKGQLDAVRDYISEQGGIS
jgi:glycosyltransferase involved in cell wall biosynthesis